MLWPQGGVAGEEKYGTTYRHYQGDYIKALTVKSGYGIGAAQIIYRYSSA